MVTDSEVTEGRDYTESLSDDRGRAAVRQNDHNDYCSCIVMGQPRQPLHDRMFHSLGSFRLQVLLCLRRRPPAAFTDTEDLAGCVAHK